MKVMKPCAAAALLVAAAFTLTAQTLLVLNRDPGAVDFFALADGAPLGRLPLSGGPREMAAMPDGRTVAVALGGADAVALIDVAQRKEIDRIPLGGNHDPRMVAAVRGHIYVVTARPAALIVIDSRRRRAAKPIPLDCADPRALAISADERKAWIGGASGAVAVVELYLLKRQTHSIALGATLESIALSDDEKSLYVTPGNAPLLWVVDAVAGKLRRQVGAAGTPARLALSAGPKMLVTLRDSGELAEWSTHLHLERRRVNTGAGCEALAMDPERSTVLVALPEAREVRQFSYPDLEAVWTLKLNARPDVLLVTGGAQR